MPIAGPESPAHRKKDQPGEHSHANDPIHALVETLRGEFKRGHQRQEGQSKAAQRKRIAILIVSLLVVAGFILIAVVIRGTIHLPH